jgi:hypothetical protein
LSFSESTARFEADRQMKDTAVRELRQLEAEALAQMSAKEKEIMRASVMRRTWPPGDARRGQDEDVVGKTNTAMMYLRMGQFEVRTEALEWASRLRTASVVGRARRV